MADAASGRESKGLLGKAALVIALALGLPVVFYWAYQRFFLSEEDRVRQVILAAKRKAEKLDPGGVLEHLHPDFRYRSPYGEHDSAFVRLVLYRAFLREITALQINLQELTVELKEGSPPAEAVVRCRGSVRIESEQVAPEIKVLQNTTAVRFTLKKLEGAWKITLAEHGP